MLERVAGAMGGGRPNRGCTFSHAVIGRGARLALLAAVALTVANCSSRETVSKIDPKYGVAPSPLVVSDGSEIPKGGGRAMVGRPYTIAGRTYTPRVDEDYSRDGLASWYGPGFHGRKTANGEVFDKYALTAAHPTMPLPSYARVTNLENNRSVIVRVNDRGPFHGNRIVDLSRTAAEALAFRHKGVARVRVDYVGPASVAGSDDRTLISTLRTDGTLAQLPGTDMPSTMVASAEPARTGPATPLSTYAQTQRESEQPSRAAHGGLASPLPPARPVEARVAFNAPQPGVPTAGRAASSIFSGIFFADPGPLARTIERGSPFADLNPDAFANLRR